MVLRKPYLRKEKYTNEKYIDHFKLTKKKGNSQILCEQFKKGAEAKGHQVKNIRIMERGLLHYIGWSG